VRPQVCSSRDGFLAKVAGLDGSKCDGEKRRLDVWVHHYYHRGEGGGCHVRELAKSGKPAHRLLARVSNNMAAVASPATVEDFLYGDPK
jgi:hypothetical protein